MAGCPPTTPPTWAKISDAAREHYPPSPAASSEGWLDKLGDGPDKGVEDLRAPTTVEQTALLESLNSARHRAL
jgi:hypothetical protein